MPIVETESTILLGGSRKEGSPEHRLEGALLRGLAWSGGIRGVGQIITWASTLVVTRLLTPADYGVLAMALVIVNFLELVTDAGLGAALVQESELSRRDAESAMGATCLLGLAAAVLLALSSSAVASFFDEPRLIPVIWSLSAGVVLTGAAAVPSALLQRRLAFDHLARSQLLQGLITAGVTVMVALYLRSYWALVIGFLAGKLSYLAVLLFFAPVRFRFAGRDAKVAHMLRFGGTLTGDRILFYLRSNVDLAIIGARLGEQALGLYVLALTFARLPMEKLGYAFGPVVFPLFARTKHDMEAFRRYYLSITLGTTAITLPAALGLVITADRLVPALLGEQWVAAVTPLRIIALFTPMVFHSTIIFAALSAVGRVDLNLRITTLTSIATVPAVLLGTLGGLPGIALAGSLAFAVVGAYGIAAAWRTIGIRPRDVADGMVPVVSSAAGMTVAVVMVSLLMPASLPIAAQLIVMIGAGMVVYPLWALVLHRRTTISQVRALRLAWSTK